MVDTCKRTPFKKYTLYLSSYNFLDFKCNNSFYITPLDSKIKRFGNYGATLSIIIKRTKVLPKGSIQKEYERLLSFLEKKEKKEFKLLKSIFLILHVLWLATCILYFY